MIPDAVRSFVEEQPVGVLATYRADGSARQGVVYHLLEGDTVRVTTEGKRFKTGDVSRTPRASYCVTGHERPFPCVTLEGSPFASSPTTSARSRRASWSGSSAARWSNPSPTTRARRWIGWCSRSTSTVCTVLGTSTVPERPRRHAAVAIVGLGPVGAALANLLGARGLDVVVYERETDVYHQPRAAHFDGEIMRVFQSIGLAEAVEPNTATIDGMHFVNADGQKLFGFDVPPGPGPNGWNRDYMFSQPELETTLRAGLARFANVSVHLGHEVDSIQDHGDRVELIVRDRADGSTHHIGAAIAVGCDGARSLTREVIGTELFDYGFDQPWLVIDTNLRRPVELPTVAVQYCDPTRPATFIPHGGRRRRWEIMVTPPDTIDSAQQPDRVFELLAPWVTPDDIEIVRATVYTFHALVAKRWRSGRVLLMGDAAHQMPPFLGQGMCSGIRDAANLAWKLELVLDCRAGDELLDTYQTEREPHVRAITETAVAAGSIIQTTDPDVAAARDAQLIAEPGAMGDGFEPPGLGAGALSASGGALLPQPGRLDDTLGSDFAVLTGATKPSARARAFWGRLGKILARPAGLESWLGELDADTVVVRPDRYVFGTSRDSAGLDDLTDIAATRFANGRLGIGAR